jgi:signal transduction histidine kinase
MSEIACEPIRMILGTAERRFAVQIPHLLESVEDETAARLQSGAGRVPWETFRRMLDRLEGAIGGREVTKDFFDDRFAGPERRHLLGGLAALFTDSRQLYRYATNVYAPGHFPVLERNLEIQHDGTLLLEVRLPIEARDSPPFWWGLGSLLRRLPRLLGQAEALVDVQISDRHAIYRITPPPPLTIAARLRSSIRGFFAHQTAAELVNEQGREIAKIHTALIETRKRLEREIVKASQREQQRIAHDLHDGLGQQLTAVSLQAKLLEDTLRECAPEYADEAARFVEDVREAARVARDLAHGLDEIGRRNLDDDASGAARK